MSAYIGSTPKAPIDPGTADFVKGRPAIVQPAVQAVKDLQFYVERIATLAKAIEHNAKEYRKAVSDLKASELWKSQFKTWGRTCRECLGISRQRGNELIRELTESYEEYNEQVETPLSTTSKAHELEMRMSLPDPNAPPTKAERQAQLDADIQAELEAQLAKPVVHAGPAPETEPEPAAAPVDTTPRDLIGFPIPKDLLPRCNQRQEVQDRITAASRLRCALEEITNKGHQNPIYGLYDWQGMIRTVGQLQFHLGQCKPEVVCYECDGDFLALKASKGGDGITRHCHLCSDRGFVTQKQWDDYSESKLAIIAKKVEARLAKCKED